MTINDPRGIYILTALFLVHHYFYMQKDMAIYLITLSMHLIKPYQNKEEIKGIHARRMF